MTRARIWLVFVLGATKKPIDRYPFFTPPSQVIENQQHGEFQPISLGRFIADALCT